MKKIFLFGLLLVLTIFCFPIVSYALTIQSSDSDSYTYNYGHSYATVTRELGLNLFDASLGTLTGVDILLEAQTAGTSTLQTWGPPTVGIDVEAHMQHKGKFQFELGSAINVNDLYRNMTTITGNYLVELEVHIINGFDIKYYSHQDSLSYSFTTPTELSAFIGTGMFSIENEGWFSSGGAAAWSRTNDVDPDSYDYRQQHIGEVTYSALVTYTYDERQDTATVPEPATMLLLGSGLVGLVGYRRKFRKN